MAPRRGGGGSYGGSWGSSSVWAEEVPFSMDVYRSKSLFLTGFAFDILFALALVGFLIWSCLIRNKNGQMKGVVLALVSWLMYESKIRKQLVPTKGNFMANNQI